MRRPIAVVSSVALTAALLLGCADSQQSSRPAQAFDATLARAWMDLLYATVRTERIAPPPASRLYGYSAVTLYQAVVPGMPAHRSLVGQLNGLDALPAPDSEATYHWPSVANAALADLLRGLLASASAGSLAAIDALESERAAHASGALNADTILRSEEFGRALAVALLAWAASDGYATYNNCAYTVPQGFGLWQPTPPLYRPALQPCWGRLRPLVLSSANFCAPPSPIPYSENRSSAFQAEAREVRDIVNVHDPALENIARFWSDDPGSTGTPPGHWVSIVGQLSTSRSWTLDVAAEAYARTGIAVADAFISCWATKFESNYPRPVTAIRQTLDPGWNSLLATPAFPEYTSGHSVQSGAVATVLTDMLGDTEFIDHTHDARGFTSRSFASFHAAADEAAQSRIYGGIHFREACVVGVTQGECVGGQVIARVHFRQ